MIDAKPQPPLPEPTTARPGSAEKVAVLEQRAAAGLELWHPEDPVHFEKWQPVQWTVPECTAPVIRPERVSHA